MNVAIYARKSTEQTGVADEAKSVTRQIEHAKAYAERKGWSADDRFVFVDDGISGAEFANRPDFLRLMNALKPHPPFQVLVMSEESRLGREAIETAYALKQLVQAGVRVFFYLEDRERTLDSPTDKIMLSLTAFADELEREKARQRTYDAMRRKAEAGHVTGGRVFGYDNVVIMLPDGRRSHVERHTNEAEAAVVRRIFALCVDGAGKSRIAKTLNAEQAPCPRPQQQRPSGWSPSSVHEVLYRPLYRGQVVWNRSRKRDRWGQHRQTARPETAWLTRDAPALRIVPEALWRAAHQRLTVSRQQYLRQTNGHLWGRPRDGESKYLLSGLARCQCCQGGLCVRSRSHGRRRGYFYACTAHHQRGQSVCANGLEVPMGPFDAAVLGAIERYVLNPAVVTQVIDQTIAAFETQRRDHQAETWQRELTEVTAEIACLSDAVAAGGQLSGLLDALKAREHRRTELQDAVASVQHLARAVTLSRAEIDARVRVKLADWQGLLSRHVAQGRQILRKLLEGPIVCTPITEPRRQGYAFRANVSLGQLITGVLDLPCEIPRHG